MSKIPKESKCTVAAIIPAYNEAGRISKVLNVLREFNEIDEIIVVDDGSTDETSQEAKQTIISDPRFKTFRHFENKGKGQAVHSGWKFSTATNILLLDADLQNLKIEHLQELIYPVREDDFDMSIGFFRGGHWRADLAHRLTPWLSGQRCLKSRLLNSVQWDAADGYGFETALTIAAREGRWQCKKVPLVGVTHPLGEIPRGGYHGWGTKILQLWQVLRAWYLTRVRGKSIKWLDRQVRTG